MLKSAVEHYKRIAEIKVCQASKYAGVQFARVHRTPLMPNFTTVFPASLSTT